MLSLTSNRLTLEQIFLKLTQAPNNDEARRMLGLNNNDIEDKAVNPAIDNLDEIEIIIEEGDE